MSHRDPIKKSAYKKRYYKKNKKRISEYWKTFYAQNRERLKAKQAAKYREKISDYLFYAAKARSKASGLPFNIEKTDIVVPKRCPVFGFKLEIGGDKDLAPSVDRIDPRKGYVKGNVAVISMRANRLKNNASIRELEKLVLYMKEQKSRKSKKRA